MRVVGLLSGGKDSCYALMQCIAAGHQPVALATLLPPPGVGEMSRIVLPVFSNKSVGRIHIFIYTEYYLRISVICQNFFLMNYLITYVVNYTI